MYVNDQPFLSIFQFLTMNHIPCKILLNVLFTDTSNLVSTLSNLESQIHWMPCSEDSTFTSPRVSCSRYWCLLNVNTILSAEGRLCRGGDWPRLQDGPCRYKVKIKGVYQEKGLNQKTNSITEMLSKDKQKRPHRCYGGKGGCRG